MSNKWSSGLFQANGLNINYHRTGVNSGKPPLLLLHGHTDNGLCWSPTARVLEAEFDVIMTDARGHGRTRGAVEDMSVDLLAGDAAESIKLLGIAPALVWGHSMGGMQTLALAANYPELVRAVVLEDPPFMPNYPVVLPPEMKQQLANDAIHAAAFQALPYQERLAQGKVATPGWSEEELIPWAESKGEYDLAIFPHRENLRMYNWRAAIQRVRCPLLLVTGGEPNWVFVTPELAQEATQLCPTCEIAHIVGAGHSIHRDDFSGTLSKVQDFLRRNI